MKLLSKLQNKSNRLLFAVLIGIVFASGAFFMQHTAEPLSLDHINQADINTQASSEIQTLYNGINQVMITGYSAINGVNSKNTQITIIAIPEGGDIYSGYTLPGHQYSNMAPIQIYGSKQDYSNAGIAANIYVSQIPHGIYNIGILTVSSNGSMAYEITNKTFESGLYEDALNILFFIIAFIVYTLCSFLCLELLFKKKDFAIEKNLPVAVTPNKHSLLSILNIIFLVVFFWIFLNVTFANISKYASIETFKALYSVWGAFVIFIVMYCVWHGVGFSAKPALKTKILIASGCIAFFLFQLAVNSSISTQIRGFDSTHIANSALSYAQNGFVTYYQHYFVVYPYNYFMLFTDIGLYKLAGGSQVYFAQLANLVNIILLDIAIALSYFCIKELFGRRPAAVMLVPLCLIIGLNPMMNMFYTDILSMVFSVLIFFLYLKLKKTNKKWLKIVLLVLIALSAYAGYQYKMTSVIILIAIAAVELIYHIKQWKRVVSIAVSCAVVFGIFIGLNNKTKEFTDSASMLSISLEQNPDLESFSFWHWIMVGLHYPYGKLETSDWDFSITRPKETRDAQIRGVIAQRLSSYGPAGYIAFLNNKAIYAFGESTFSVGNNGNGNEYNMPGNIFSKLFQDVFGSSGKWFPLFAYTLQGAWVLSLFLIICPLFFRNKKKVDINISILRITLGGILVYLLVSENNTRQLVNQLPVVMILASSALPPVMSGAKKLAQKALANLIK